MLGLGKGHDHGEWYTNWTEHPGKGIAGLGKILTPVKSLMSGIDKLSQPRYVADGDGGYKQINAGRMFGRGPEGKGQIQYRGEG